MLSSDVAGGRSGMETPIISADSRRVDTEERRLWCEFRLEVGAGFEVENEEPSREFVDFEETEKVEEIEVSRE
jgi:hypothetical protein